MSEAAKSIALIVQGHIKPFLQQEGFRKKANTFWRNTEDFCDVINVQLSHGNFAQAGEFTINLGVYWHQPQKQLGQEFKNFPPKEYECTFRERLGSLAKGRDYWWEVDEGISLDGVGQDVVKTLSAFGMPWLKERHEPSRFVEHAIGVRQYFDAAVWSLLRGDKDAATKFLRMELESKPRASPWIEQQAKRVGLLDES